ncbi:MAG: DUF3310 domain-containing protein [Thermoplasmata archaeon]
MKKKERAKLYRCSDCGKKTKSLGAHARWECPAKAIPESVGHPAHYGGENNVYEAIKVIEAWGLGFHLGNTVKYIARVGRKPGVNPVKDLKKARWYLDRAISNYPGMK